MPELVRSIVNMAKVFINTINIIAMHVCIIGIYVLSFSNTLPHGPLLLSQVYGVMAEI